MQLDLAARPVPTPHRLHVPHRLDHLHQPAGVLQALRRLGFLQPRQQRTNLAQLRHLGRAHAQRHPLRCAEQIGQHRCAVAAGLLKPQRRPACAQHAVRQRRHLQLRRHRGRHTTQFADAFQLGSKVTQISVFHEILNKRGDRYT